MARTDETIVVNTTHSKEFRITPKFRSTGYVGIDDSGKEVIIAPYRDTYQTIERRVLLDIALDHLTAVQEILEILGAENG